MRWPVLKAAHLALDLVTGGTTLRGSEHMTRRLRKLRRGAGRGYADVAPAAPVALPARGLRPVPRHVRYVALVAATATVLGCLITVPASAATRAAAAPAVPAAAQASAAAAAAQAPMITAQTTTVSAAGKTALALRPDDTSETAICLSNKNADCVGVSPEQVSTIVLTATDIVVGVINIWLQLRKGKYIGKHRKGSFQQLELEDNQNGLCLADTGGYAYLTTCEANGTYWFVVPHNDGAYLESRYEDGLGVSDDLTADPLTNNARLYVHAPANSGSPYWQTWTGYPAFP